MTSIGKTNSETYTGWIAIQMRVATSPSKRLRDALVAASTMVGAMGLSVVVGTGAGFLVTVLWFRNTRSDGLAAFLIAAIAAGLFASVVAYVLMVCRHHIPSPYTVLLPALLWLILAIRLTWTTCKDSFITVDNALWILRSGDQRNFELSWLIRGWVVIAASLVAAIVASRWILRGRRAQSTHRHPQNSSSC